MRNKSKQLVKYLVLNAIFLMGTGLLALADAPTVPAGSAPAAGTPAGAHPETQVGIAGQMVPLLLMFAVFWVLMIRPQQKKMREQQAMLSSLKHGDDVVTASGILGKITGIADKVVTVEVDDNVHLKILKSQVSQVIKGQIKDLA